MRDYTPERQELKEAGFLRQDRHNQELWIPPGGQFGITFKSARRKLKQLQKENDAAKESK